MLKQRAKSVSEGRDLTPENDFPIEAAAERLAAKLFPHSKKKRALFVGGLRSLYSAAVNKDILIIHSPGGWGNSRFHEGLQDWEKSIVTGVTATLEKLGYSCIMRQYFRCGDALWGGKNWFREGQFFYFGKSFRAYVFAQELKLIVANLPKLKIVLVGASQGAAFNNKVMVHLGSAERIYSIELGTFFAHMRRRQLSKRNLAIDSNGLMPDPMCHRDLWKGTKAYFRAFVRWSKYRAEGKRVKFTNCINTPGHEYQWEYPEVNGRISAFLTAALGEKH